MENISKIKLPNNTIYNIIDNQPAIGSASGELCSFSDGSNLPMPSLKVGIEPQQDLHGYDAPWVGGAGKNKLNPDIRKYGSPYAVWGGELSSNTPNGDLTLDVGTYTFSMNESVTQINVRDNPDSVIVRVYSTNVMTFTIDQRKAVKIAIELRSGQDINNLNFQLESGSTATAWQPYSNICPISGWDEVNVSVSGVNVWDEDTEFGYYYVGDGRFVSNTNQLCAKNYISVKPNMALYGYKPAYTGGGELLFYDKSKNYISYLSATQWINKEFTIPSNCYYITFNLGSAYGTTYNNDISINYPSTDTDYHAYNGQTYTIDLDGTRYGGKVDLVSGVMTVDRAYFKYINVSTTSGTAVTDGWRCNFTCPTDDINKGKWSIQTDATPIFNKISVVTKGYGANEYTVTLPNVTSKQEADAMLEGLEICYKLITPITYQLTPTAVKSLLGSNNVWADTGEIIDCEYVRDKYDSITAKIAEHVDWAGVNNKPTIPTAVNNVTQTATDSNNASYELLFSNTADNITRIEGTRKSSLLTFSPESSGVQLTMNYDGSRPNNYGDITIKGNNDSDSYITLHSSSAGMSYLWIKHPTPSVGIFLEGGSRSNSSSDYSKGTINTDDFIVSGYDWEGNNITWDGTNTSLKAAIQSLNDRVTALENT